MSESDTTYSPPPKNIRDDPSKWKQKIVKDTKIKGDENVNYKMKNVAAKEPGLKN